MGVPYILRIFCTEVEIIMDACKTTYSAIIMLCTLCESFAMSGTAPELPTNLKLTLHIALEQVNMHITVVLLGGVDAQEPDICKYLIVVCGKWLCTL